MLSRLHKLEQGSSMSPPFFYTLLFVLIVSRLDIAAWLASCPVMLQPDYWHGRPTPPHIISVLAAAHHVRILLHRPTCYAYHSSDAAYRSKAVDLCVSAAYVLP